MKQCRFLVVEDYDSIQKIFAGVLISKGQNFDIVDNVDEAIEKYRNNEYHAVISDNHLARGGSGIDLLRKLYLMDQETGKASRKYLMSAYPVNVDDFPFINDFHEKFSSNPGKMIGEILKGLGANE